MLRVAVAELCVCPLAETGIVILSSGWLSQTADKDFLRARVTVKQLLQDLEVEASGIDALT